MGENFRPAFFTSYLCASLSLWIPMTAQKSKRLALSIFFPAFNEEANLEASVQKALESAPTISDDFEVIIVNDGSKDRTGEIADALVKRFPGTVRAVHHEKNRGYGAALWSGYDAASKEYVFFTDTDLQFDLEEIKELAKHVPEYDAVLGYRAKRMDSKMRLLNAWGWNVLNRALFGLKVRDIDCAFKLIRRDLVVSLPLETRGAMMSAEMLIRMSRNGVKFKEIPVSHYPRTKGVATGAKLTVILRALREMSRLYFGSLRSQSHTEAARFAIVGIINTAIDFVVYLLLTRALPSPAFSPVAAKAVSFAAGTISSFFLNRGWTFGRTGAASISELFRFYVTVGSAAVINVAAMFVMTRVLSIYDIAAVAIATIVTFIWSFSLSKFWVFAPKTESGSSSARESAQKVGH